MPPRSAAISVAALVNTGKITAANGRVAHPLRTHRQFHPRLSGSHPTSFKPRITFEGAASFVSQKGASFRIPSRMLIGEFPVGCDALSRRIQMRFRGVDKIVATKASKFAKFQQASNSDSQRFHDKRVRDNKFQ